MNASLLTADRRTHLKIVLLACMCSLGACALAANLEGAAMRERAGFGSIAERHGGDSVFRAPTAPRAVIVSLHAGSM